jgi:hypothetical protein
MLLGFLLLNLLTSSRYPFVWIDEVMYSDPAVNLLLGNGFTSSDWYAQQSGEFWAGNVPGPSFLLFLWIKLFGFSVLSVRSLNYLYVVAACWLLWQACVRLRLIPTARLRLLFIGLLLSGYSIIFAYRSGRPDCVAMLLISLLFYAFTFPKHWRNQLALFLLGVAAPWIGLQLLPLIAVGGFLLVLYAGRAWLSRVITTWCGVAMGVISLLLFYASHGVLGQFLKSIRPHTSGGFFSQLLHGRIAHSNMTPKDFSFMFLFLLAAVLALGQFRKGAFKIKSALSFGIVYSIVLTLALLVSGKFPTYYGWMTYVPLSLCLCATLSQLQLTGWLRWTANALLGAAIGVGILLHAATAAYDWQDRDYALVEKLVRENINQSDWMYGEHATYYAAKTRAARLFLPFYLPAFPDSEKQRLTVLMVAPADLTETTNVIGGNWLDTGVGYVPRRSGFLGTKLNMGFLSTHNYRLEVYRRAGNNPTSPSP